MNCSARVILTLMAIIAILLAGAAPALAAPADNSGQCPGATTVGNVPTSDGSIVLPAGLTICIHASNGNTGQIATDGVSTLADYIAASGLVNNGGRVPNVSNYVIYTTEETPSASPSPSETPTASPTPTPQPSNSPEPSETPSPTPSVETSPTPSSTPTSTPDLRTASPTSSVTTGPTVSMPPTDTEGNPPMSSGDGPGWAFWLSASILGILTAALMLSGITDRRSR